MKKKKSIKSTVNLSDIIIGLICISGMLYFLFMFWKDLNVSFSKANEEPIAVIYFKKNTAQRKLADGNIWERLKTASPIYDGDKIRTAALSEAYTIFDDCTKIDIHENTLIQVFNKENKNSVNFVSGSISVLSNDSKNENIKINTGNKVISFEKNTSAVISFSSADKNKVIITVAAGDVLIDEEDSENKQSVSAGSSLEIEPVTIPQEISNQISDFRVSMPPSTYSVTLSETEQTFVPYFWNNSKDICVDFSRDAAFTDIIQKKNLSSSEGCSSCSIDFVNEEKALYWRASPLENQITDLTEIPHGVIFINRAEEILMLNSIEAVFGEEAEQIEKQVLSSQEAADSQFMEIISENLPESINIPEETDEVSEKDESLEEIIEENSGIQIEAVAENEQNSEELTQIPNIKKTAEPAAVIEPVGKQKPEIEKLPEEVKTKAAEKITVPETEIKPEEKVPGFADKALVLLSPEKNKEFSEADFMTEKAGIRFEWSSEAEAQNYLFEIYNSENRKILEKIVSVPEYVVKDEELSVFENGTFTWCVTAKGIINEKSYSGKTTSSTFTIRIEDIEGSAVDTKDLLQ